jgi:hypothetical protein
MSIYKSEQRDDRTWWQILAGLFLRRRCPSYIAEYRGQRLECQLRSGHEGKHHDTRSGVRWGYGDNWLEMAKGCFETTLTFFERVKK